MPLCIDTLISMALEFLVKVLMQKEVQNVLKYVTKSLKNPPNQITKVPLQNILLTWLILQILLTFPPAI